jgi:DNA-binding IclR family transcriptional regulator
MEHRDGLARTEVLDKAIALLELLADHPQGLPLNQIVESARLPKTSAHRLLLSWIGLGYVAKQASGAYVLGLRAIELSRRVARRNRPVEICHGILRELQQHCGESVYLGIYRAGAVVLVDAVESSHALRVVVDLGEQCYLHASAQGLAVAAHLDPQYLAQILPAGQLKPITAQTNTDWTVLQSRLQQCRDRGYAVNEGETVAGAVCLGAPIFAGESGPVLGSVGISTPVFRATPETRQMQIRRLLDAAAQMSRALDGLPAESGTSSPAFGLPRPAQRRTLASH